jgi:hypothetical protein
MKIIRINKNIGYLFLLLFLILLSLILFTQYHNNSHSFVDNESFDDIQQRISDEKKSDFDYGNKIAISNKAQGTSCGECHEDFNPFTITLNMPKNVNAGEEFAYELTVINDDSETPHNVEDLEAVLTGLGETSNEPFHNSFDGSILRFQGSNHRFPVTEGASSITVHLTGDSGFGGLNNIDLMLTGPNGDVWRSTGSGVEEDISLYHDDIATGGFGDYTIQVQYISGLGPITYSVNVDVTYNSPEYVQYGEDLNPDESYTFRWDLILTSEQLTELGSEVSGTVSYIHEGGDEESFRYTFEITLDHISGSENSNTFNFLLENGRILGFLALFMLILIMTFGFSSKSRRIISKPLKIKNPQNVHCIFSLVIILFAIIHATVLIIGPYSWNSSPNIYGTTVVFLFGAIAFSGFYKKSITQRLGEKIWKRSHLIMSIAALIIIIYHAVTFGGHFT